MVREYIVSIHALTQFNNNLFNCTLCNLSLYVYWLTVFFLVSRLAIVFVWLTFLYDSSWTLEFNNRSLCFDLPLWIITVKKSEILCLFTEIFYEIRHFGTLHLVIVNSIVVFRYIQLTIRHCWIIRDWREVSYKIYNTQYIRSCALLNCTLYL